MACRRERALFCRAVSGWPTSTRCQAESTTPRRLFERLLSLQNDVGLLSEEYDWQAKRLVGNFPQALSHVALVNTAFVLNREAKRRAPRKPPKIHPSGRRPSADKTLRHYAKIQRGISF